MVAYLLVVDVASSIGVDTQILSLINLHVTVNAVKPRSTSIIRVLEIGTPCHLRLVVLSKIGKLFIEELRNPTRPSLTNPSVGTNSIVYVSVKIEIST